MKKTFYKIQIIALLTGIGIFSSCGDFFDMDPQNSIKETDFYRNREDLNAAALGMYTALANDVHKFLLWGSARADLVEVGQEGRDAYVTEFVNNNVSVLNPYTSYAGLYQVIARSNRQLEHIDEVEKRDKTMSKTDIGAYYAEAYFMRALCYFYLVRTFNEFPVVLEDVTENVTFVKENGDVVQINTLELSLEDLRAIALKPQHETEVWKLIMSDLKKAMGLMPVTPKWNGQSLSTEEQYGRASLAGIYALSCEVALWMGEYMKSSAYADLVIKNTNYSVGTATEWGNQFVNTYAAGLNIFLLGYNFDKSHETNRLQEFTSNVSADGGMYLLKPVKKVLDELFSDTKDGRIPYTYKRISRQDLIWKYICKNGEEAMRDPYKSVASWHIINTAEVHLLKGMAENRMGNVGGGITFLNNVREKRGLEKYDLKKLPSLDMLYIEDLLLVEKARESAFEGKRWYDLLLVSKVFGRTDVLPRAVSKKYPTEQQDAVYQTLTDQSKWYLPIEPGRWK